GVRSRRGEASPSVSPHRHATTGGPRGKAPAPPRSTRQQCRLIEASFTFPPRMQRHWDQKIGIEDRQTRPPDLGQQVAEGRGERSLSPELEGVQRLSYHIVVEDRGSRIGELGRSTPALAAAVRGWGGMDVRAIVGLELSDAEPARAAPRRRQALDALPTAPAQWITATGGERAPAHRAEGGEDEIQERAEPDSPCRRGRRPRAPGAGGPPTPARQPREPR